MAKKVVLQLVEELNKTKGETVWFTRRNGVIVEGSLKRKYCEALRIFQKLRDLGGDDRVEKLIDEVIFEE